jgi:flavin-binding protein dodecin
MTIAKVIEVSSSSKRNFEDAVKSGIKRASRTVRNIRGAWIKEQSLSVEGGKVTEYRVNMLLTFVLDDAGPASKAKR